jgi:hypothetical protein
MLFKGAERSRPCLLERQYWLPNSIRTQPADAAGDSPAQHPQPVLRNEGQHIH